MGMASLMNQPNYAFTDKWPNKLVAQVVALTMQGYTARQIFELYPEVGSPGSVTTMWALWDVKPTFIDDMVALHVPLTNRQRSHIGARAQQHGLGPGEYARRILVCASMPVDRYAEIVRADQFDDVKQ